MAYPPVANDRGSMVNLDLALAKIGKLRSI